MYNNPYYAAFNPYGMAQQHSAAPTLQSQQIIQVNGKASVDTIQLAPNSSVLLMDTTAPIVWMCVSDGVGKCVATPYKIEPYIEKDEKADVIEKRLQDIETSIADIEKRIGNREQRKSDVRNN